MMQLATVQLDGLAWTLLISLWALVVSLWLCKR